MEVKVAAKVFGGSLFRVTHQSTETKTPMTFSVYLPNETARLESSTPLPYLLYLSGLTCTDENVCQKSGVFKKLSELKIAFVAPDTSPRGAGVEGEDGGWDFGTGAGFYLDATSAGWKENYRMYSYITNELPALLAVEFPCLDPSRVGITGHSMGGHGALTIALKNPTLYKSVSAFSPICNPIKCPWGQKAFNGYLLDKSEWEQYDATQLISSRCATSALFDDILVDVGTADSFLTNGQLLPDLLQKAADASKQKVTIRYQDGYDHSYYFISTFIDEHLMFHASRLGVQF